MSLRTVRFSSFRLAMAAVGLSAAAVSQAAFANFFLHDPHKVITPGAQSVWFSGRIEVNEDNPGTILWAVHAYLETIGNHALEVGSYAQSYFDWLGAGFGKHAGDVYDGDLFELVVDGTEPLGLYNQQFGNSAPSAAYVYKSGMNTPENRSNSVSYSVQIVPEPATMAALGLGVAALIRRRRK